MSTEGTSPVPRLEKIDVTNPPHFIVPVKRIHNGDDVSTFLSTRGYKDIMTFLLQLNRAMFPSKVASEDGGRLTVQPWLLGSDALVFSEPVRRLQLLLERLESIIDDVPPDTGPRRFGNISFRRWHEELEKQVPALLEECISSSILELRGPDLESLTARSELTAYLLGSFGSSQRLDYGTGHELSFLAFLGCLWKLNGFPEPGVDPWMEERGIVLGVIEPYVKI
jgi:serine/threonine-protein phosphatase 2A activator